MDPDTPINPLRSHPPPILMPGQRPVAPSSQSAAQTGHLPAHAGMDSIQHGGQGPEPRAPVPIRPVGKLSQNLVDRDLRSLAELASPDRTQTGNNNEGVDDGEPKFPEQVYNVLLVGAAGVGQTSLILYFLISTIRSAHSADLKAGAISMATGQTLQGRRR